MRNDRYNIKAKITKKSKITYFLYDTVTNEVLMKDTSYLVLRQLKKQLLMKAA